VDRLDNPHEAGELATDMRRMAARYHAHTGRALVITHELGELKATQLLGLRLTRKRGTGHNAVDHDGRRVCIRSRIVLEPQNPSPICINSIRLDAAWDAVILVLFDRGYEVLSIHRAARADLEHAMRQASYRKPGNRPAFSINTFCRCGVRLWPLP
jgi:hypothetical protein